MDQKFLIRIIHGCFFQNDRKGKCPRSRDPRIFDSNVLKLYQGLGEKFRRKTRNPYHEVFLDMFNDTIRILRQ
jgi:glucan biosynthesis protein